MTLASCESVSALRLVDGAAAPASTEATDRAEKETRDDGDDADSHQDPTDRRHDRQPEDQADNEQQNSKTNHVFLLSLHGENEIGRRSVTADTGVSHAQSSRADHGKNPPRRSNERLRRR